MTRRLQDLRAYSQQRRRHWKPLIEHRHSYANLVLMCGVHSDVIDDPKQQVSVAELVQMKLAHEREVADRQRAQRAESARSTEGAAEETQLARPLLLDDIGLWQRRAVVALASDDPEALRWLRAEIGEPPDPERVETLIARWPQALADRSELLADAVIRHAEAVGLWSEAADGSGALRRSVRGHHRSRRSSRACRDRRPGRW